MTNKDTISCPNCGSVDIYIEYHKEKEIGDYDERWDEFLCNKCGHGWSSRINSHT